MHAVSELENIKTAYNEKNNTKIESETLVMEAKVLAEAKLIVANKTAEVVKIRKNSTAQIIGIQGSQLAQAYKDVKASITSMNDDQLLKFIYLETMLASKTYRTRTVAVGIPPTTQTTVDGL